MKKLGTIFMVLVGLSPMVLNGSTREEVTYRFYENLEDNIHYELYPERVCSNEIVDYNDFVYTDYIVTSERPEDKRNRIIEDFDGQISIDVDYVNYLFIGNFENILGSTSDMRKLELFDKNGEKISYVISDYRNFGAYPHVGGYTNEYPGSLMDDDIGDSVLTNANSSLRLKLDRAVYLKDLVIKVTYKDVGDGFSGLTYFGQIDYYFSSRYPSMYAEKDIVCEDNLCTMTITTPDYPGSEPILIDSKLYKYKDAMYKCYSFKRNYVPGYYSGLEGFIKDEDKFKVELIPNYEEDNEFIVLKNKVSDMANEITDVLDKVDKLYDSNLKIIERINNETSNEDIKGIINLNNDNIIKYIDLIYKNTLTREELEDYITIISSSNESILEVLESLSDEENVEELKNDIDSLYKTNSELIDNVMEDKELDVKNQEDNDLIAMKDVTVKEVKYDSVSLFLLAFGSLSLIISLLFYIRTVKKSRTK